MENPPQPKEFKFTAHLSGGTARYEKDGITCDVPFTGGVLLLNEIRINGQVTNLSISIEGIQQITVEGMEEI